MPKFGYKKRASKKKVILDLCGGTGAWSKPYADDKDYEVHLIDTIYGEEFDVRVFEVEKWLELGVHGVLAAPPCTAFASSGAQWWERKGHDDLLFHLSIVDACIRIAEAVKPAWWCLENPVGRLSRFLGKPKMTFHPWFYGDPYTKLTCLWGDFNIHLKLDIAEPVEGSKMLNIPESPDRWAKRSVTPQGFAKAFKEANS